MSSKSLCSHTNWDISSQKNKCPTSGERLTRGYTKLDFTADEGKGRLNPSHDKNEGKHRRKKVEKSCVTFLLCDPGWYVHRPDVQNKWDDKTHTRERLWGRGRSGSGNGNGGEGERRSAGRERGQGSGDGAGTGTGTGVETRRRTPDGNGDGNGNGDGSEDCSGDGSGDEDNGNGNEDIIGEGGREAKKRKKPQNNCRRHVGNGGDLAERGKHVEKKGLVQ